MHRSDHARAVKPVKFPVVCEILVASITLLLILHILIDFLQTTEQNETNFDTPEMVKVSFYLDLLVGKIYLCHYIIVFLIYLRL